MLPLLAQALHLHVAIEKSGVEPFSGICFEISSELVGNDSIEFTIKMVSKKQQPNNKATAFPIDSELVVKEGVAKPVISLPTIKTVKDKFTHTAVFTVSKESCSSLVWIYDESKATMGGLVYTVSLGDFMPKATTQKP